METQMGSVTELNRLAGLTEWLDGEGREQGFKCDSGESAVGTASASKIRHSGKTGLDVGRVFRASTSVRCLWDCGTEMSKTQLGA